MIIAKVCVRATVVHIEKTPGIAGGKPRIAGHRIRVQDVYIWHEHLGMSADEIASSYNLTLVQIYAALTYAFEHLEEIREDIREANRIADEIAKQYPSKLAKYKHDQD
jgi:uncharacterized protein (DUF433 family)